MASGDLGHGAQICKFLKSPGIDSKDLIPPAYVAWRSGTLTLFEAQDSIPWNRFLGSLNVLQMGAQISWALAYHLTSKGSIVYRVLVFLCCRLIWGHPPPTQQASYM